MKHSHSFAILLTMAIAVPTLTSCLGDDDNSGNATINIFDQEQKSEAIRQLAGYYTTTISYNDGTTGSTTWHVQSDSTIVCSPFPMKVLVNALASAYPTQSEILSNAETQKLTGTVHPVYSYGSTNVFTSEYETMSFTVGEGIDAHAVEIVFGKTVTKNGLTAQSSVYYTNQQMQVVVIFDKVTIDGTDYSINNGLSLTGTKQ